MKTERQFPRKSAGFFIFTIVLTLLAWALLLGDGCSVHFGFGGGGSTCDGWVAGIGGVLVGWILLSLLLVPASCAVALWHFRRWTREQPLAVPPRRDESGF
jgi:hypothetical protein